MSDSKHMITAKLVRRGTTLSSLELHVTGGIRAVSRPGRTWCWDPVIVKGCVQQLPPVPIDVIDRLAKEVGLLMFGGDDQSGLETPLTTRVWTPLDGPGDGTRPPADTWHLIARNAEKAGDISYGNLARNIAVSVTAAGTKLRDASDGYRSQLIAAIRESRKSGTRFSNIAISDVLSTFHPVLSELASARDYLATALANKLGAPAKVDAMNRFARWLETASASASASGSELEKLPVVQEMLTAYSSNSADPWLYQITTYRNLFLHERPLTSRNSSGLAKYNEVMRDEIIYPRIEIPLGENDPFAPGTDALTQFVGLYHRMIKFIKFAARHAPYGALPLNVVLL